MRLIFILLFLSLLATACGPLSPAYYQPPRENFETWEKPEASRLDIMKAMLECGEAPIAQRDADINMNLLADWCMEASGYKSDVISMEEVCKLEDYKQYPACQPDAVIPKPSVERRLNSEYCQYAKSLIDPVEYQRCLKEDAANPLDRTTAENCAYWNKDLRAECRL